MFSSQNVVLLLCALSIPGHRPIETALPVVNRPCSIQKVIRELGRRSGLRICVDSKLADSRIAWSFADSPSAEIALFRIAELTGGKVVKSRANDGGFEYTLQKKSETAKLEARWRRERMAQIIGQLVQAHDDYNAGALNEDHLSTNAKLYLPRTAAKLKALKSLTGQQLDALIKGKRVPLNGSVFGSDELRAIVDARRDFEGADPDDRESPEDRKRFIDLTLGNIEKNGLSLQLDYLLMGSWAHLMLIYGGHDADALTRIGDEELGLPNRRLNPYEMIDKWPKPITSRALPEGLSKTLEKDVICPASGRWEDAVAELGREANLDVITDGYLCRSRSVPNAKKDGGSVLATKGTKIADALDKACEKYGYIWWVKDGCCYFRACGWVWDMDYEPPDRFLDHWSKAALTDQPIFVQHLDELAGLTRLQLNGLSRLGSPEFLSDGPDRSEVAVFLQMYRNCPASNRMNALGSGLQLNPADADLESEFSPPNWITKDLPHVFARLEHIKATDKAPDQRTAKLAFRLSWDAPSGQITSEFVIEFPRLPDPFNPKP